MLGLLVVMLGIPTAAILALPYPIKLALKIVWKTYCLIAALILAKWMLSPLHAGVDYITGGEVSRLIEKISGEKK